MSSSSSNESKSKSLSESMSKTESNINLKHATTHKEFFDYYDSDKDGFINLEEFIAALRSKGIFITEKEFNSLFKDCEKKFEDKMNYEEFKTFEDYKVSLLNTKEDILEALKIFDKEGNGQINVQEFKYLIMNLGESIDEEDIDEILDQVSIDTNGYCSIDTLGDKLADF